MFGTSTGILPTGSDATIITGITSGIGGDIVIILSVLAFVVGLKYVVRFFNHSVSKGKL
jgi:hypothetical protein